MKKIISLIVIGLFVLGLYGVALAQQEPTECCKLHQSIPGMGVGGGEIAKDTFVGPDTNAVCDINGDGKIDDATDKLSGGSPNLAASNWGVICLVNTVYTVTNWIFYLMTLVAVLMIIYGGFTYIAAAGDPAKASKGKTVLTLSIIGLAIALLAKFVPSLVKFILGV